MTKRPFSDLEMAINAEIVPTGHEWTRDLAKEVNSSDIKAIKGVESCQVDHLSKLIKVKVSVSIGYNFRPWTIVIGGPGLGCNEDALWGGSARTPVLIRYESFAPFSILGVDDTGCVSADFWEKNTKLKVDWDTNKPSLVNIIEQAIRWLEGAATDVDMAIDEETRGKFNEALEYTRNKTITINEFRNNIVPKSEKDLLLDDIDTLTLTEAGADVLVCYAPTSTTSISHIKNFNCVKEVSKGVYSFPLFTSSFCERLITIIDSYESSTLPKRRPNTMNNYGMVTNDIGLKPFIDALLTKIIHPMAEKCFPNEVFTSTLDHHHTFVVVYKGEELGAGDRKLDMHHDASEITLNVCLGRQNFKASGLRFCGNFGDSNHRQQQYQHEHTIGHAVMHLGRHRHGADEIMEGERINLIIWARSSSFRAAAAYQHVPPDGYPQEKELLAPHMLCLSKPNDKDYEKQIKSYETLGHTISPDCGCDV